VLFTAKSKLSVMKKPPGGGAPAWESRGVGKLTIRRFKQGPNRKPHIFFTTDAVGGGALCCARGAGRAPCRRPRCAPPCARASSPRRATQSQAHPAPH
jgi:hypothetical protein